MKGVIMSNQESKFLEIVDLKKGFGSGETRQEVLRGMNFSVAKGEFCVLLGPSGSGKSTLLNIIGGIDSADSGYIAIHGDKLENLGEKELTQYRRKHLGYVFQMYNLIANLNVKENIEVGACLSDNALNIDELLQTLGLYQHRYKLPNQSSGGQQQRVAIARALVKLPRVLLLDEPLSNLDARLRLQTREEIRRIQQETQITTIFVTHDQDEAMSISDMIVVMKDGIVQQIGKPQNVYDDPVNLFVAKFLGTPPINVFSGEVKNEQLYIGSEAVLSTPGVSDQPVHVGIRPEGFILKEDGPLSCDLVRLEVMGRDVSIVSTHEQSQNVTIRSIIDADEGKSLPTGKVHFGLKPAKVFLFCTDTEERIRF